MLVTVLAGAAGPFLFGALADVTASYTASFTAAAFVFLTASAAAVRWRLAEPEHLSS